MLENIAEVRPTSKVISDKCPRVELKLFQTDVDEGWNNFISHVTTASLRTYKLSEVETCHASAVLYEDDARMISIWINKHKTSI